MIALEDSVAAVSAFLRDQKLPHCLIGGLAVAIHGYPRATFDIDFLTKLPEDLDAFLAAAVGAGLDFDPADRELAQEGLVFLHLADCRVDLLGVATDAEATMVDHAQNVEFAGTAVPVIRVEDLVAMKLAAGRPRDELDAEELLKRSTNIKPDALFEVAQLLGVESKARFLASDETADSDEAD